MGYNYASAFVETKKMNPSSAEYQFAEAITMTALAAFHHDFGVEAQLIPPVEICGKTKTVRLNGTLGDTPLKALYSFSELGFSM